MVKIWVIMLAFFKYLVGSLTFAALKANIMTLQRCMEIFWWHNQKVVPKILTNDNVPSETVAYIFTLSRQNMASDQSSTLSLIQ